VAVHRRRHALPGAIDGLSVVWSIEAPCSPFTVTASGWRTPTAPQSNRPRASLITAGAAGDAPSAGRAARLATSTAPDWVGCQPVRAASPASVGPRLGLGHVTPAHRATGTEVVSGRWSHRRDAHVPPPRTPGPLKQKNAVAAALMTINPRHEISFERPDVTAGTLVDEH
jgi:hypothetical protein